MSSLSAEAIQSEALAIVDELGSGKLTMRRVASRLGVEAPSLYHHVPNKAALVDLVADALWAELPEPPADGSWSQRVRGRIDQWQQLLAAHPHAVALIGSHADRAAGMLTEREALVQAMADAGVADGDALLHALSVLVLAQAGSEGRWLGPAVDALLAGAGEAPARAVDADAEPVEEAHGEVEDGVGDEDQDDGGDTAADGPASDEGTADPAPEPEPEPEHEHGHGHGHDHSHGHEHAHEHAPEPAPRPEPARATPPPPRPQPQTQQRDSGRGRGGLLRGIARRLVGNDD